MMIPVALVTSEDLPGHGQERRSRRLLLVYGLMAVAAMAAAVVPQVIARGEFLGNLTVIAVGILLLTGIWSTAVSSLAYGVVGGGLVGIVFALSGTIIHTVNHGLDASESLKLMLTATLISSILGSVVALLGGLIVWGARLMRPTSSNS